MDVILRTDGVIRSFHSGRETVHALKGVSIYCEQGKLTLLRGRSGSGKTTLMNLLGALDRPNAGHIWFRDKDISKAGEAFRDEMRRKNIGFIFQSVALISMMSAYENVEFGLRVAGVKSRERKKRAEECLSLVGLAKRMHHRPQEMSGGEQQRVAIARAIAHRPDIVFADEPTAELDSHMGLQVMGLFKALVEKEGLTVVITTHDPGMLEIADHAYTLEDGEIVDERKG
jgi:putative ABC transport system ATP-binding protein